MIEKRLNKLLELLIKHKKMDVGSLAKILEVSQVTIRKDLTKLEERGIIHREHGYAVLQNMDDIAGRLAYHYEEKRAIAQLAAKLIKDGDTIMIENGSCCALLARELALTKKFVTIITNSGYIAHSLRRYKNNFQIILLGGIYQQVSECMVGPMVLSNAENFNVEYFFIGTDGYNARTGFSNKDQMRAQAVRDMSKFADKVVVLTESEKFNTYGTVPLNLKNKPAIVVTDDKLSEDTVLELRGQGMEVLKTK